MIVEIILHQVLYMAVMQGDAVFCQGARVQAIVIAALLIFVMRGDVRRQQI
jgi:hypothetical protein